TWHTPDRAGTSSKRPRLKLTLAIVVGLTPTQARARGSIRRPDRNPLPSHRATLRHVDHRDREILSRDVRLAVSIDELVLIPEPKSSRVLTPLLNRTGICRHHGPVETRRMLIRLHREPVALRLSVPFRARWERIHDAHTIPVERHTAADLFDIRGRFAEPGCRFDVGRRSLQRHCLLRRVAGP